MNEISSARMMCFSSRECHVQRFKREPGRLALQEVIRVVRVERVRIEARWWLLPGKSLIVANTLSLKRSKYYKAINSKLSRIPVQLAIINFLWIEI